MYHKGGSIIGITRNKFKILASMGNEEYHEAEGGRRFFDMKFNDIYSVEICLMNLLSELYREYFNVIRIYVCKVQTAPL